MIYMKRTLKAALVAGSLLIIVLLSACGSASGATGTTTTAPTPTPTTVPTPTPMPQPVAPAGFTQFKGSSFTLAYPSDWTHHQVSNYYAFSRSDVITQFIVGLHNNDKDPCAFLEHVGTTLSCTHGDVGGIKHSSTVVAHGLTWKQDDWTASLANNQYILRQLTYVNTQTNDTTTIVYAGYLQVGSPAMITFEQAAIQYFEQMFQSFRFQ